MKTNELQRLTVKELHAICEKVGFNESIGNKFFRSGKKDSWKQILNRKQIDIIEKNFSKEMKELKYI